MLILLALGAVFPKIVAKGPDENLHNGSNILQEPRYPYETIMLPEEHIPYFLHNNLGIATACRQDPLCPYKVSIPFPTLMETCFSVRIMSVKSDVNIRLIPISL